MEKKKDILVGVLVAIIMVLVSVMIILLYNKNLDCKEVQNKESELSVTSYIEEKDGIPHITLSEFESINNEIKAFYNEYSNEDLKPYTYHVYEDVLFLTFKAYYSVGLGGDIAEIEYYIDLKTNTKLSVKEVFERFVNEESFKQECSKQVYDSETECNINNIQNEIKLIPSNSVMYVESKGMGQIFENTISCSLK